MKRPSLVVLITVVVGIVFMLTATSFSCNKSPEDIDPVDSTDHSIGQVQYWLTTGDRSSLFSNQKTGIFADNSEALPVIKIDTTLQYQSIDGFGAALTGSSAIVLQRLSADSRHKILETLFDKEKGIGISVLRISMGASDFSAFDFTYNDLPSGQTDFELTRFNLNRDTVDVIPVLKEILAINPDVFIMATPWSPPAWMKTNQNLKGGKLKTDCYAVYAEYFVKYIKAMQQNGIKISAITPQNEPLFFTANYPCMEMQASEQADFIKNNLGPAFNQAGLDTKIIIYDHNWDNTNFAVSILNDADAAQYVSGSAFHAYAGNVSAMTSVHNAHPDKGLYFTEISGGAWATDFASNLMWNMNNIFIGSTKNWSRMALLWNLALDENYSPQNNGCNNCRGVVTVYQSGTVTRNEEFYSIAHFSKAVLPGAVRVNTLMPPSVTGIYAVTFMNTDNSKVIVIANDNNGLQKVVLQCNNRFIPVELPAKSVMTVKID